MIEITLTFKKKEKEGEIKIEAWGRNPKPLQICLENANLKRCVTKTLGTPEWIRTTDTSFRKAVL